MSRAVVSQCRAGCLLGLLAVTFCLGCWSSDSKLEEKVLRCAKLDGARQSQLSELAEATAKILSEGGGPEKLTISPGADATNAAAVIVKALSDSTRLRLGLRLDELARPENGIYFQARLEEAKAFLKKEGKLIKRIDKASNLDRCASGVRLELGFFDRYAFLDDAAIAARIHMLIAATALDDESRDKCLRNTLAAAKWIHWLAKEQRLEARLLACQLRQEWFDLLRSITSKAVGENELRDLFSVLREQLNDWPPDRVAFVSDRAITMHAYEALRLGMVDRVITADEKKLLEQEGLLEKVRALDRPSIDQDELAYVKTINRVITACSEPYSQRTSALAALFQDSLFSDQAKKTAPLASRLFLPGIPEAIESMARDRAMTEAWALAIASAAQFDLPPYRKNPLNGQPYEADRRDGGVGIRLNDYESLDPFVRTPSDVSSR